MDMSPSIPMVDLALARTGSVEDRRRVAGELFDAFRVSGFAYAKNHGIPDDVVEEAFRRSKDFFALPVEIKELSPRPDRCAHMRGYSRLSREKLSQNVYDDAEIAQKRRVPDLKESFDLGRDTDEDLYNVWPAEEVAPGFRAFYTDLFARMAEMEREVLRLIAIGLKLYSSDGDDGDEGDEGDSDGGKIDEEFLVRHHKMQDNQVRLLHYPPVSASVLRDGAAERIAAHTDFGTVTMLFQDQTGGLEVEEPDGSGFRPVPWVADTVLLNVGDLLMRWSNDVLKSTMHRVGLPRHQQEKQENDEEDRDGMVRERYSIAYFCVADRDRVVECLPGCAGPGRPRRYEATTSREYVDRRMAAISGY